MGIFGDIGSGLGNGIKSVGNLPSTVMDTGKVLVIGGIVIVGGILLMGVWSISSGRTKLRDVAEVARMIK